jgi:DNA-binding GntR family transcriptional regulator
MMPSSRDDTPRALPARVSLADGVYEILLSWLVDGTRAAGSPLNIDALARDLSVSQTPVREALARLEATGLVSRTALKGYRVAPLFTDQELADLMDARAVIEPANAFLSCGRVTTGLVDELRVSIVDLEASARRPDFGEFHRYWEADERFHNLIASHTDNRFLKTAYDALGGHVQRFRLFGALGITDAGHAAAEHTAILAAFEAGAPEGAREAMATHIANVKTRAHIDREAVSALDGER